MTDQRLPFQQPEGDPRPAQAHPGTPRDVNLAEWLNAAGFHPADTEAKQMGHEAARVLVGLLGKHLHRLVPAGREKSVVFSHLEQARHYANQALAVHGGPPAHVDVDDLRELLMDTKRIAEEIGATVPEDLRIEQYKTGQLAPTDSATPEKPFEGFRYSTGEEPAMVRTLDVRYQRYPGRIADAQVAIGVTEHDEGENRREMARLYVDDPDVLEEFAAGLLAAANRLRRDRA